ncbi:MAG TPA: hypothetical protein VMR81_06895 [Patescibacteria group bacterium]|nr:hypothetical protein [Patescibacteria group bacterium]
MKIQDLGFFVIFIILFSARKPKWFVYAGLLCLLVAIPLYAKWVFFTGERLVLYAGGFLLTYILRERFTQRNIS